MKRKLTIDDLARLGQKQFKALQYSLENGFASVTRQFESIDNRFKSIDNGFESIDSRLNRLEKGQESIFAILLDLPSKKAYERLEKKVNSLEEDVALLKRYIHK